MARAEEVSSPAPADAAAWPLPPPDPPPPSCCRMRLILRKFRYERSHTFFGGVPGDELLGIAGAASASSSSASILSAAAARSRSVLVPPEAHPPRPSPGPPPPFRSAATTVTASGSGARGAIIVRGEDRGDLGGGSRPFGILVPAAVIALAAGGTTIRWPRGLRLELLLLLLFLLLLSLLLFAAALLVTGASKESGGGRLPLSGCWCLSLPPRMMIIWEGNLLPS